MAVIAAVPAAAWEAGCRSLGHDLVPLPPPGSGDLRSRLAGGGAAIATLADRRPELILDLNALGLMFVEGPGGFDDLKLLHEQVGATLVSHLLAPVPVLAQALGWEVLITCLGSRRWIKVVSDAEAAQELHRFGIPGIAHLPPAAADAAADCIAPVADAAEAPVAFIGDASRAMFPGLAGEALKDAINPAARAAVAARGRMPFFVSYFEVDRVAEIPAADGDSTARAAAIAAYFAARTRYAAALCRQDRDRLVALLAERLDKPLVLHGRGWEGIRGAANAPAPKSAAAYLERFRRAAINVVAGDGWSESGLTTTHFEVTAAGGFLLCPYHPRLRDCFELGREIETYSSDEELFAKIDHYLARSADRVAIAAAGQQRTRRNHLVRHRLDAVLRMAGFEPAAPPEEPAALRLTIGAAS